MPDIYKRAWELLRIRIERSRRQTVTKVELRLWALQALEQAVREVDNVVIS